MKNKLKGTEMTKKRKPAPRPSILDADFRYTSSVDTDVAAVWMRHGWTPPPPCPYAVVTDVAATWMRHGWTPPSLNRGEKA